MPQITYEQTVEDWIAFNRFHHCHSPQLRKSHLLNIVLVPLFLVFLCLFLCFRHPKGFGYAFNGYGPGLFIALIYPPLISWGRSREITIRTRSLLQEKDNQGMLGLQVLILEEAGVKSESSNATHQTAWKGTNQIVIYPDQSFAAIYVSSMSAHLIPRRSFPDEAAFLAFVDEAKRLQAAVKVV